MPKNASKANAVLQLKEMYHCDKVVVFGDAMNDYDMFKRQYKKRQRLYNNKNGGRGDRLASN